MNYNGVLYSRVGPVLLGPPKMAMPWVYCYLPINITDLLYSLLKIKNSVQIVEPMEESALSDVSSDQLL